MGIDFKVLIQLRDEENDCDGLSFTRTTRFDCRQDLFMKEKRTHWNIHRKRRHRYTPIDLYFKSVFKFESNFKRSEIMNAKERQISIHLRMGVQRKMEVTLKNIHQCSEIKIGAKVTHLYKNCTDKFKAEREEKRMRNTITVDCSKSINENQFIGCVVPMVIFPVMNFNKIFSMNFWILKSRR